MERGHFKPLQAANINTVSICILNITYIRKKSPAGHDPLCAAVALVQ